MTGFARPRGSVDDRVVLVFELAGRLCAFPSSAVAELVYLPELAAPPGMPSFLAGVMNVEGVAVPVVDLARLLGLDPTPADLYTPVLLMRGREPLAFVVDRVRRVARPGPEAVLPVSADTAFGGCLEAELKLGDEFIHLLSPSRLLLAQESRRMAEFRAREQERLAELDAPAI